MTSAAAAAPADVWGLLAATCAEHGLPWSAAWLGPLQRLAAVLARENALTNLVGDATPSGLAEHVVEALAVAAVTVAALGHAPQRVVDVGAGAGLEALTLALVWPTAQVVAVEPRTRRAAFTVQAAAAMGAGNVRVLQKTLESAKLGPDFDLATARAVWPPAGWLPKANALLTRHGVAALHGHGPPDALAAAVTAALAQLAEAQQQAWHLAGVRAVPGPRGHAVAVLWAPR